MSFKVKSYDIVRRPQILKKYCFDSVTSKEVGDFSISCGLFRKHELYENARLYLES